MRPDDLEFVAGMLADAEVMRFYPSVYSKMEAKEWIDRQLQRYRDHGHGLWLVEEHGGAAVGQAGLSMQEVDGIDLPEIGYLIARSHWRRGYAAEAAAAIRTYAFETLGYPEVVSLIRVENLPSRGVATKLGMKESGLTMHHGIEHLVYKSNRPT